MAGEAFRRLPGLFDRTTVMWMIGGLTALGIAAVGFIWSEIGSVREEFGGDIDSLREEVRENRAAIAELAKGQARIDASLARLEAILDERLPRNR